MLSCKLVGRKYGKERKLNPYGRIKVRKRIQGLINEAKKGNIRANDLHKELDEWGLFKEYEDEFLALFR